MHKHDKPGLAMRIKRKFMRITSYEVVVEVSYRLQPLKHVVIKAAGRGPREAEQKALEMVERELVFSVVQTRKDNDFEVSNNV